MTPSGGRSAGRPCRRAQLARPLAPGGRRLRALRPAGRRSGSSARGSRVTVFTAALPGAAARRDPRRHPLRAPGRPPHRLPLGRAAAAHRRFGRVDEVLEVQNGMPFLARLFTRARVVVLVHHVHREQWPVVGPVLARVGWFLESTVGRPGQPRQPLRRRQRGHPQRAGRPRRRRRRHRRSPTTGCRRSRRHRGVARRTEPAAGRAQPPGPAQADRARHRADAPRCWPSSRTCAAPSSGQRLVARHPGRPARRARPAMTRCRFLGPRRRTHAKFEELERRPGCTCCPRSRRAGACRSSRPPASACLGRLPLGRRGPGVDPRRRHRSARRRRPRPSALRSHAAHRRRAPSSSSARRPRLRTAELTWDSATGTIRNALRT